MFDKDLVLTQAIRAAVVNMMTNPAFVNTLNVNELWAIKRTVDHITPPESVSNQLNNIHSPEGQVEYLRKRFGDGSHTPCAIGYANLGYQEPIEPGDLAKAIEESKVELDMAYPLDLRSDGRWHFVITDEMVRQQALYKVLQELALRGIQDAYRIGDDFSFFVHNTDPNGKLQMINTTANRRFSFETTMEGFNDWLKKAKSLKDSRTEVVKNG